MKNKIVLGLLIFVLIFGLIQFYQPEKNWQINESREDIFYRKNIDPRIVTMLKTSCYDCHSNNTAYPWYNNIAPVSWMIANHVNEGKEHLNFSHWSLYIPEKQHKLLKKIMEDVEEGEMPLSSYLIIHSNARISDSQKELLKIWATYLMVEIENAGGINKSNEAEDPEESEEWKVIKISFNFIHLWYLYFCLIKISPF